MPRHGKRWELWADEVEIECEAIAQSGGPGNSSGISREASVHLLDWFEEPFVGSRAVAICRCEVATTRDGRKDVSEVRILQPNMMDLVGGDSRDPQPTGDLPQKVVSRVVLRHCVMPQLHVHP